MNLADLQATGFAVYALKDLFPSESNVRSNDKRTPEDVMNMALSIHAHGGLLQNLVVVPELKDGQRTGRAEVTAGETRRQALMLLASGGVPEALGFDLDFLVPVREVASAEATATSASENLTRSAMHPADQFKAFAELYEQCGSVEQVAAMFGVTPLVVQRRLKLAAASPRLFELFRADGGMSLEQLMALCVSDDHAAQERVWDATKGREWDRSPQNLRRMLTQQDVAAASPLARFVTVKAYEAEGGEVRRDLFSEEGEGFLTDAPLLRQLAEAKLEKAAAAVRKEGWLWVEARTAVVESYDLNGFTRGQQGMRPLTEAERAELARLQAEHDEADADLHKLADREEDDDDSDDLREKIRAAGARVAKAGAALSKLQGSLKGWTPEVLGHAGAVVALDRSGKAVIHRGLVRPEDRKAAAKAAAKAEAAARVADDGSESDGEGAPKPETKAGGLSESLTRRLTAHRTVALQRMLADNTQVALAALAHNMVQRLLGVGQSYRTLTALDLQAKGCEGQLDGATESSFKNTRAWAELQALRDQWGERMPGDEGKLLAWLIRLSMADLCDLLALCTALSLDAIQGSHIKHEADALAEAVGLDMADWWEPTAGEYLTKVPKQLIAQALSEASMSADAARVEKMKKGEAVATAEALLQGKRWLPAVLKARRTN